MVSMLSVWFDDGKNCLEWHLGVIDSTRNEGQVFVSNMMKTDKKGLRWPFPDIQLTRLDQIIVRNIPVSYQLTSMIRCEVSQETVKNIQSYFNDIE